MVRVAEVCEDYGRLLRGRVRDDSYAEFVGRTFKPERNHGGLGYLDVCEFGFVTEYFGFILYEDLHHKDID